MEINELKEAAHERGFSVIKKRQNGPVTILVAKTGNLVGVFPNIDEAFAVVQTYAVIPPVVPQPVEWTTIAHIEADPIRCPNGYGPTCLCLDNTFLYLCAVGPCPNKAECNGTCRGHFSQLRVFGDLTNAALKKTDEFHQYGRKLSVFPALLPLKMYKGTSVIPSNLTPSEVIKATDGIIGMAVKFTGTEYVLLDKDGHVLDRVKSKNELFEE